MLAKTKTYRPSDKEPFMNERQRDYFRAKLLAWREDILKEAKETLLHLQEENQNHPDLADRASSETDQRLASAGRNRPSWPRRTGASNTASVRARVSALSVHSWGSRNCTPAWSTVIAASGSGLNI